VRTERAAAAVAAVAVLVVMVLSVAKTENPYKVVSNPLKSHIHIVTDEDKAAAATSGEEAVQSGQPAGETTSSSAR
jgi:hypothetical protein